MDAEALSKIIKTRRSIRSFTPDDISDEVLGRLLNDATWAPSGKNYQNWKFFVVRKEKIKDFLQVFQAAWTFVKPTLEQKLKPKALSATEKFFLTLGNAPVVILAFSEIYPTEDSLVTYGSVFMAVQNLLLLAHAEGLGTCVLGRVKEVNHQIMKLTGVTNMEFICGVALGHPDTQAFTPVPARKEGKITFI